MLRGMFDPASLDELSKRLTDALPGGLVQIRDEIQKSFRAILQGALSQMNLVSREEFDVQREVLARTRAKLEALEAQIAELEKQLLKP
jgi:BMFP domain-containing protein YqiC